MVRARMRARSACSWSMRKRSLHTTSGPEDQLIDRAGSRSASVADRPVDGVQVALFDRQRDVGADPGQCNVGWPTLMDSRTTTKNQLPDMDIIMFHSSAGIDERTSRRQKRIHGDSRKEAAAFAQFVGHGAQPTDRS